ncbi:hypothetical protein ZIOFF_017234 [Zingiber officinale]|uniref:BED-type domain-containing protein n=1 Tax=Zingiber officinale TaxID=94328 RepID=A0A8J5HBH6_ZINOF|nr:hypothetical protein ZIOFF_017234 [Zingiber officinale]
MEESSILLTINSVIAESNEVNLEINKQIDTAGQETQENAEEKEEEGFQTKKRKKISEVWNDFDTVDGSKKAKCKHCQSLFTLGKSGATSSLLRHRLNCVKRKINLRAAEQQTKLSFLSTDSASPSILTLHSGKFDMEQMREAAAHWIMMHEHPFTSLDEEGFNLMMRRSEYPTSNLFLQEVQNIKLALDIYAQHEDLFLKQLASKMKEKFDKYWGDCNLLMAIAVVLDPTKKMLAVEFCFPKLYSELDASKHISKVKEIINSLYEEYVVEETNKGAPHLPESESFGSSSARRSQQNSVYNWDDFDEYCAKVETSETKRSELVDYLEKGRLKKNEIPKIFSCLEWWRMNRMQYPILSKIEADILAIPVSSVASEATFSAGTRVIDSYRSSLSLDTVQTLLCGGDWLRHIHELKKKTKKFDMEFWKHMLNKEEDMEIAVEF